MLGESQLNVYILGSELSARQRERIQAQVEASLRALPGWLMTILSRRIETLGVRNLPLIVEPQHSKPNAQFLSLGQIEDRPAARIMPALLADGVDWGQDRRYLVARAVAYMAAPDPSDEEFWHRWSEAVVGDRLREKAQDLDARWQDATDLSLLIEMLAAYALNPRHSRWSQLPRVTSFLEEWRMASAEP